MTTLEDSLRSLGDHLDIDDSSIVDDVLARLEHDAAAADVGPARARWVQAVAVAVVLLVAVTVAVPSSRRTVAGWFGFDGATVERDIGLQVPVEPDSLDGRGAGTPVVVSDREILVAEFVGTLENPALSKVLSGESDVTEVTVNGATALWIDGAPHQVSFLDADGEVVFEGFAGNTLLWQDGVFVRRLEGFDAMTDAVAYAESLD